MTLDSLLFENLYWKCFMNQTIKNISNPPDFPCCHAGLVNSFAKILCGVWTVWVALQHGKQGFFLRNLLVCSVSVMCAFPWPLWEVSSGDPDCYKNMGYKEAHSACIWLFPGGLASQPHTSQVLRKSLVALVKKDFFFFLIYLHLGSYRWNDIVVSLRIKL